MKPRLMEALENMRRHNAGVMSRECFGFEPEVPYDALVVATGWKPDKTVLDPSFTAFPVGTICTPEVCFDGTYAGAYFEEKLPAFTPGGPVLPPDRAYVDRVAALGRRLGYEIKPGKVFCTDSIALEYSHLDEIRATGAELIEMETALFYRLADLFEVPAVALLAVSDNSATGAPLLGRQEPCLDYRRARGWAIPDLIYHIAKGDE